jgi:glutamate formiminotransferase/formiminotetrahydrofolate cyclodeaminase
MWQIIEQADELREKLRVSVEEDAKAYQDLMLTRKLPKDSEEEKELRNEAIQKSTLHAAKVPLEIAINANSVLTLAVEVAGMGNVNAITDAGTAGNLAFAAIKGASLNVRINLTGMVVNEETREYLNKLKALENQAAQSLIELENLLNNRGGLIY